MSLPAGYSPYRRSPVFTAETIPTGLRTAHRTKPGVWALIHVLEGCLLYRIVDPPSETLLVPGSEAGVIAPDVPHEVAPIGTVRFFVEFHRAGEAPPPAAPIPAKEGRCP